MRKTRRLSDLAGEVKRLHDRDEALSRERQKNKQEQRDIRLHIGRLVTGVSEGELGELARRSGYTAARLKDFRAVAAAWPKGSFPAEAHFTALEELRRDPERFTKIKTAHTKRDARAAKGGKVDTPSRWAPDVKADFIKEALADPDVAREVARDINSRASIARGEQDVYRESRERRDLDPAFKASRQTVAGDDVIRQLTNARYMVNRALDQAMSDGMTDAKRSEARDAVRELATSVDWIQSYLDSGDTSFEQALDDLLRSQEN